MIFRLSIILIISSCTFGIMAFTNNSIIERTAYAADNCDPSSTCTNVDNGLGNTQTNDCTDLSICRNEANGNDNTQNNDCNSVPGLGDIPGCSNRATGDGNTQSNRCDSTPGNEVHPGCRNSVLPLFSIPGDDNTQNMDCVDVGFHGCENNVFGGANDQNMDCQLVGNFCINQAIGNDNSQNLDCTNVQDVCINNSLGNDNTQDINCNTVGQCSNDATANTPFSNDKTQDTQNIDCDRVGFLGCSNFVNGDRNDQKINCFSVGDRGCSNNIFGDGNTQSMKCYSVGDEGCQNFVFDFTNFELSNDSTQNTKCLLVKEGCLNFAQGDGNNQKLLCVSSTKCSNEINSPTTGNTQKTVCVRSDTCTNVGTDTKVISVGSSCKSSDIPGTTTICVNGRNIIR